MRAENISATAHGHGDEKPGFLVREDSRMNFLGFKNKGENKVRDFSATLPTISIEQGS